MNAIRLGAVLLMHGSLLLKEEGRTSRQKNFAAETSAGKNIGILEKSEIKKQRRDIGNFQKKEEELVVSLSSVSSKIDDSSIEISVSNLAKNAAEEYAKRGVMNLREAGIKEVFCLIDSKTAFLKSILKKLKVQFFFINHNTEDEKLSSLRAALKIVSSSWTHCLFYPANMPYVRAHTIKAIRNAVSTSEKPVIMPSFNKNAGVPFIVRDDAYSTIILRESKNGIKGILDCFENELVELPDSGVVRPIYTMKQYEKYALRERRGARSQPADCSVIWDYCGTGETIRPHLHFVGEVAYQTAHKLSEKGVDIDPELAHVGALLHGVAKGLADTEALGAQWVHDLGFPAVAPIIASSRDLPHDAYEKLDERAVVFWADKIVKHNKLCTIDERYVRSLEQCADNPDRVLQVLQRREMARDVQTKILKALDIKGEYHDETTDSQTVNNMWDEILSSGNGTVKTTGLDQDTIQALRINPENVEETEKIADYFSDANKEQEFMIVNVPDEKNEWCEIVDDEEKTALDDEEKNEEEQDANEILKPRFVSPEEKSINKEKSINEEKNAEDEESEQEEEVTGRVKFGEDI